MASHASTRGPREYEEYARKLVRRKNPKNDADAPNTLEQVSPIIEEFLGFDTKVERKLVVPHAIRRSQRQASVMHGADP
jgi:hypothetical protein